MITIPLKRRFTIPDWMPMAHLKKNPTTGHLYRAGNLIKTCEVGPTYVSCSICAGGTTASKRRVVISGWQSCPCFNKFPSGSRLVTGSLNGTYDLPLIQTTSTFCRWFLTSLSLAGTNYSGFGCTGTPSNGDEGFYLDYGVAVPGGGGCSPFDASLVVGLGNAMYIYDCSGSFFADSIGHANAAGCDAGVSFSVFTPTPNCAATRLGYGGGISVSPI